MPCLSWRLCVLSKAGVRNPSERGVADRCVKKRGICRPSGAGFMGGWNPALTRWAIVWRPSGPGATAWEDPKLPRSIRIEPGSSPRVFDTDADPDTDA
jgi:hypothetical protein